MDNSLVWNPLAIFGLGSEPMEQHTICCGIAKTGACCKNIVKRREVKEGLQELRTLAENPLNLINLRPTLASIAKHFLCKRWHRQTQADDLGNRWFEAAGRTQHLLRRDQRRSRSHPETETETATQSVPPRRSRADQPEQDTERLLTRREFIGQAALIEDQPAPFILPDINSVPSPNQSRLVTAAMLRENRVSWQISDRSRAVLSVANHTAGQQLLELRSFEQGSSGPNPDDDDDDVECYICFLEDDDEPVMLTCGNCSFHVHLDCMENWLGLRRPGNHPSCPQCRSHGAFDARFQLDRDIWIATETMVPERVSNERADTRLQPPFDGSLSPGLQATARETKFHDELPRHSERRSDRLARHFDPTRVTQSSSAPRRSERLAQRNDQRTERHN